jgi:hypothetical protein
MKKTITFAAALTVACLDLGSAPAWAQATAPAPAPAPGAAPAPAPAPETSPVSMPSMSGTLAANTKPLKIDAGPLGGLYVTGALSGIGLWQSNPFPGDEDSQVDVTNGQVVIQKVDGPIQFYAEGGAYSFPTVGSAYTRAGNTTSATFGGLPVWFLKWAPNDSLSVQAGDLPTLIGAEYAFTFQNVNIERGLIWNQENIINRGVQVNYTQGPLALSLSWNDGYFSQRYSWITGSATYTIDSNNSVTFDAGGNLHTQTVSSSATPVLQNNYTIFNFYASHTSGAFTIIPTLQYAYVSKDTLNDLLHTFVGPNVNTDSDRHTFGAGLYGIYALDGGYSVAGRVEYITSNGQTTDPGALLAYGGGSKAWSFTITPTWQKKFFFARGELSYVKASSITPGLGFGETGNSTSQTRALVEAGVIF